MTALITREELRKEIGVGAVTVVETLGPVYYESGHLKRIAGRTMADHLAAMRRYWNAVADLL